MTGSVDANGNPITNVGEPVLTTDVATANYVNARTAGKGRIIALKCGWTNRYNMSICILFLKRFNLISCKINMA